MPTIVDKTIGGASPDYSTLQAWEDAAPANLVTADQVWRGLLRNQTFSYTGSSAVLTISGSTSDSTRYKELTCEAGASFKDHANKLTNALRASSSNGALITSNTTNYVNSLIVATEPFCRLVGLQISVTNVASGKCLTGGNLYDCILESGGANATDFASVARQVASARNCLFISRRSGVTGIVGHGTGTPTYWNCTFVVPSDLTAATNAIVTNYTYTRTFRNCAFFGVTNVISSTSGSTFTTCKTDSSQSISGVTQVAYDTSTGSGFEATTDSARDFRIKSTSALANAGTTYSTDAPADIVGTTRPQGASYDIGCWEYSSSTSAVTSDFASTFTIVAAITVDLAQSYSLINSVLSDLSESYSVLGAVNEDLAATYTVINAVSADLAATYTVVAEVQSDFAATYAVINAVSADLAATYTVINAVETDLAQTYSVNGAVQSDLAATYTVINAVSADLAQAYSVNGAVSSDLDQTFSVIGTVSSDLAQTYTVENESIVTSDLAQTYTVIAGVQGDLAQTYAINGAVQADLTANYSLINSIQADLAQSFEVLAPVQSDLGQTFAVIGSVSKDLAQTYILLDAVESDLAQTYTVFSGSGGTGASAAESWAHVIEGGLSAEQMLRVIMAAVSGQTTGVGTLQERYLSRDGSKPRITADFDSNSNRIAVTVDGT